MYQIEFVGGKLTESTTNAIAELICTQNNASGNDYLLLDAFVDYYKVYEEVPLTDQQITTHVKQVIGKTTAGWQIYC